MQISPIGLIVFACLLLFTRGRLIVGLLASLAFGATALMTLTALGGSSPLIYTMFAALLIVTVASRRRVWAELGDVLGSMRSTWLLITLMIYAVAGAWLFPRLFAGQTTVFIQSRILQGVVEVPLAPVTLNVSQTGYFVLGGVTALAICILLLRGNDRFDQVRQGFFAWCILHASMGMLDLAGKLSGAGDILKPIRTASYAMLTEVSEAGFWRIAGAFSEASTFGGVSLSCLAFSYTYWRLTGRLGPGLLAMLLLLLTLLSTSSTAYVGLTVMMIPVMVSLGRSLFSGRFDRDDLLIAAIIVGTILIVLTVFLIDEQAFDPILRLVDSTLFNKAGSGSGQERTYWNVKSVQAFFDTSGLGIGFGSSRASSWPIAVASQLGVVGSVLMALMVFFVVRGLGDLRRWVDPRIGTIAASVRSSALAGLVTASVSGGSADPGMAFFISFAVIASARAIGRQNQSAAAASGPQTVTAKSDAAPAAPSTSLMRPSHL